jgi:exopolysaccharide production protein ExoZ
VRVFHGIQVLRGLAALAVLCGHAVTMRWGELMDIRFNALFLLQGGVDIFFVISGFIIVNSATESGKIGRIGAVSFGLKRFIRLYPVYWLVLAAAIVSSYWIDVFPREPGATYPVDFRVIFSLTTANWYVAPAWSICYELYFYAAMSVVLLLTPHRAAETILAFLGVAIVADILNFPLGLYSSPMVLEFGLGVVIAAMVRGGLHQSWPKLCLLASAILFGGGWYFGCYTEGGTRLLTYGFGSAFIVYATVAAELNGTKFSRWLQHLGAVSYSLYLSHHLLLTWLAKFNPNWLPEYVQIAIWIALAIALACLAYELIERPTMKFGRRVVSSVMGYWFRYSVMITTPMPPAPPALFVVPVESCAPEPPAP